MIPELVIDTRERKEFTQMFKNYGYEVKNKQLSVGDYAIGDLGFEHKYTDFLDFEDVLMKCKELQYAYKYPILIVELSMEKLLDLSKKYGNSKWKEATFFGLVGSLTERGIPPIFTGNKTLMVQTMHSIIKKHFDGISRPILTEIPQKRIATDKDSLLGVYMNLPTIGYELAKVLLEKFPSLSNLLNATKYDLMTIRGIGEGRAMKVYEFLHK
jgi:ERCC4-type nuclease